jgi:hypothetical protein
VVRPATEAVAIRVAQLSSAPQQAPGGTSDGTSDGTTACGSAAAVGGAACAYNAGAEDEMWFEWSAWVVPRPQPAPLSEALPEASGRLVASSWVHRVSLGAALDRGGERTQVAARKGLAVALLLQNAERWRSSYQGHAKEGMTTTPP